MCRKWPISAIRDRKKLYSFFLRNCIVFLKIVNCKKWPISATRDLVHDRVFCDKNRVPNGELQVPFSTVCTLSRSTVKSLLS